MSGPSLSSADVCRALGVTYRQLEHNALRVQADRSRVHNCPLDTPLVVDRRFAQVIVDVPAIARAIDRAIGDGARAHIVRDVARIAS